MSLALIIFCIFPMAYGGKLFAQSPDGALKASGKTSVTSDGKMTINLKLKIALKRVTGQPPTGSSTNTPSGLMATPSPSVSTSGSSPPVSGAAAPPGSPGPDPKGPPASSPGTSFEEQSLQAHNYYRSFHDSPPMKLNTQMNNQATAYADKIAQRGALMHSPRGEREGQGENLYMGCSSKGGDTKGSVAVKSWYDEVCRPGYAFGSIQSPGGAGHFTQVVWSDSTELGVGKATVQQMGMQCTYVVARYKPLGNFNTGQDDYNKNVKKGSNFDKNGYCNGKKRKRNQLHTKSVLQGEKIVLGLPETMDFSRKHKISQKVAVTGF